MKLTCLVVALVFMLASPVHARLYQWQDPDTGTTQLSGKPPAWYRSGRVGPRVFVFENGRIIDDTDIVLSDEHRELMRQRAYLQADEDLAAAKRKAMESGREKTAMKAESTESETVGSEELDEGMDEELFLEPETAETGSVKKEKTQLSLEDMKQLILDWERQQEEKAREIIGN